MDEVIVKWKILKKGVGVQNLNLCFQTDDVST